MKKSVVLLIAIFIIVVISIFVINAQSPTPSPTSSPTSSPSPTSSLPPCSGEASMIFVAGRNKDFSEEDTEKIIADNIEDGLKEIYNRQDYKDFVSCKIPTDFSCPSHCSLVVYDSYPEIGIAPGSTSIPSEWGHADVTFEESGSFTEFIGVIIGHIEAILGNNLVKKIVDRLVTQTVIFDNKYPCPPGTISSFVYYELTNFNIRYGWYGIRYGIIADVSYKLTKLCRYNVQPNPYSAYSKLIIGIESTKLCVDKE